MVSIQFTYCQCPVYISFLLYLVAFDREYRRAHELLSSSLETIFPAFKPMDRPPSFKAVFCRRFFKPLDLKLESTEVKKKASSASLNTIVN